MNGKTYYIFYAEDDIDDQDLFIDAAHLVSESLQVIIAKNGEELITLLNSPPPVPNAIFLDLNLPIKNGFQILKEIRQSDLLKNLPVVIFSTSDDANSINSAKQFGANLYIIKPSFFNSLKNAIRYSISLKWETLGASDENFVYDPTNNLSDD